MRLLSVTVLGGALIAVGLAAPATGEATATGNGRILVEPDVAHPGQRVELEVHRCPVGRERHWVTSPAFTKDAAVGGKGAEGRAVAQLRRDVRSGTHTIVAHCGGRRTVTGSFKVSSGLSWPVRLPTDIEPPNAH